jgi:hypothetical protein
MPRKRANTDPALRQSQRDGGVSVGESWTWRKVPGWVTFTPLQQLFLRQRLGSDSDEEASAKIGYAPSWGRRRKQEDTTFRRAANFIGERAVALGGWEERALAKEAQFFLYDLMKDDDRSDTARISAAKALLTLDSGTTANRKKDKKVAAPEGAPILRIDYGPRVSKEERELTVIDAAAS